MTVCTLQVNFGHIGTEFDDSSYCQLSYTSSTHKKHKNLNWLTLVCCSHVEGDIRRFRFLNGSKGTHDHCFFCCQNIITVLDLSQNLLSTCCHIFILVAE